MTLQEQLNALESEQLRLQTIMARSDAHASKCTKLGLNFCDTYPDELTEYEAAREEYNENEVRIEVIKAEIEREEAEPMPEE